MPLTTNFDIPYPASTAAPDIPTDMAALAAKLDLLLTVPAPTSGSSSSTNVITSTSYAALPSSPISCAITNPSADFALLVDVTISAWLISNGTVELTCSVAGSGGMTFAAGSTGNGHALSQGENLINTGTAAIMCQSTLPVIIPAGAAAVTFAFQAKRNSASGTENVNFPAIRAIPRRFMQ